jgi:predicted dienelactone hydrolase
MTSYLRRLGLSLVAGGALTLGAPGASAIEVLKLRFPVIDETLTARVSELASPDALWAGTSDLAELNRATRGSYARALEQLLSMPLPKPKLSDSEMAQQVEVLLRRLIDVDPGDRKLDAAPVLAGLKLARAQAQGRPITLLDLLQAIPGESVTIRLDRAIPILQRIHAQEQAMERVMGQLPKLGAAPASLLQPGSFPIQTSVVKIPVNTSAEHLQITVVRPQGVPSRPPVVISHGLWDAPSSFLGWAQHLASHGVPVFLARHPGSDHSQQAAMLAGQAPPPDPKEFLRRPRDVKALLDALQAGTLPDAQGIRAENVTVIGHSWGGTTALQLGGARSLPSPVWKECDELDHPNRNLSWVLQCTFLPAATADSMADPRITRVVAVSPPQGLVFAAGLADLRIPVLLVSGSNDQVVPPTPEALTPFASYPRGPHRLVLVEGGSHFNLPAKADSDGGPLRALLLQWSQGQGLAASTAVSDPKGMILRLGSQP